MKKSRYKGGQIMATQEEGDVGAPILIYAITKRVVNNTYQDGVYSQRN